MASSTASPALHSTAAPPSQPSPMRVLIPTSSSHQDLPMVTPIDSTASLTGNATSGVSGSGKEKVGRWTEHEHMVFLEGLEKHGKQWKTIAGMIGTRTVVQVRTHAQKYFQKMERKTQSGTDGSISVAVKPNPQLKRKSLPGTLPSNTRKKVKKTQRLSLSLDPNVQDDVSQQEFQEPSSPSPVPTQFIEYRPASNTDQAIQLSKSVSSTGSENWSTFSPNNVVTELIDFNPYAVPNPVPLESVAAEPATTSYDLQDLGEDPLEWLIDIDTQQYLPESSLPAFPDLGESTKVMDAYHHMGSVPDPTMPADDNMIEDAVLNNMVDPHVTMQSLFLPNEQLLEE